jgi:FkbM family methyltransferase
MKLTTSIKISIKRYLPAFLFKCIHTIYNITIAKFEGILFAFRIRGFTEKMVVPLSYFGHSFSLLINPKNGFLDKQIYAYKKYEVHILEEMMKNIHRGMTVLDVGANIGHHSLFMSRLVGATGKVIALEPMLAMREQFEKSIALNSITNINIEPLALGEKESTETIYINKGSVASSSIVNTSKGDTEETIHVVTLDSLSLAPSFMKIDVEGYEYFALQGGEETVAQQHPVILLEYSPIYYRKSNPSHSKDIITFLRRHNYSIFDLEDGHKKIIDDSAFISSFAEGLRSQTNIICIPKN